MFDDAELDQFFDGLMSDAELDQFFDNLPTDEEVKAFFAELEAEAEEFAREIASWPELDLNAIFTD